MDKLFDTVVWVPSADPIGFFFSYYLDFCILFRKDGYFNLSHLVYNYNICCEYSDILEYARTEFLVKIENDIVYINTGQTTDGVYISWYYLTKILNLFYDHVRNNFTELTNLNYTYLLISNNIKFLKEKIDHLLHSLYTKNKNIYLITPFELKHTPKLIFTQWLVPKGTSELKIPSEDNKYKLQNKDLEFDQSEPQSEPQTKPQRNNTFLRSEIVDLANEYEKYKSIKASIVQEQKRLLNLKLDVTLPKVRMNWINAPVFVPSNQALTHPPGFAPKDIKIK